MVRNKDDAPRGELCMRRRYSLTLGLLVGALWSGWASEAVAQAATESKVAGLDEIKNQADLDKAITALDTKLFDAYNHCDLKTFDSLLADDVEFYHDQGGETLGRQKLTESVKNNICTGDTQRVLVPGTLKIYYMKGYGAIEMGVHRFLHPKTEASDGTGEASFVQLWQYKDGNWKLTRVLSYDHHSVSPKA
jgi:ketosteroid isomerase-like protein